MDTITYFDRKTGTLQKEEVFGEKAIRLLYGGTFFAKTVGWFLLHAFAKWPFFAKIFGWFQKTKSSKERIAPFIHHFNIDESEFATHSFASFNDFFIRSLTPASRPLSLADIVIPADGRYLFYEKVRADCLFSVKGRSYSIAELLRNDTLAASFDEGTLVIARLCPTDCHRFYFPVDCIPDTARCINGKLYSVNPIAIRDNPWIWCANLRYLTLLHTQKHGKVAFMEVGATNVGTVVQTYTPNDFVKKGSEKGYFSFGGSAILMLFEPKALVLSSDLQGRKEQEIKCLIGQPLSENK
jgi:phosphatidylserine decarboxylase